jgi:hypothetical protein
MLTGGTAVFGLLLLVASYFVDGGEGHHMRFWTNLLHNATYFTGISFIACFAYGAFTTAYAGWFVQFKRLWESFGMFLLPAMFIFGVLIVGLWTGSHHMYHWNDAAAVETDNLLNHKSAFLNPMWYAGSTILFLGIYYWIISTIRKISIDEDTNGTSDYSHHRRIKKWAAPLIGAIGFTSPFLIWQWIMSIDAHWYSTMFAWYASASVFVAMIALTIMLLIYLKSRGYYPGITDEHFHDLGKYLFAISIFWTYLWFSQFMLIWYGNIGEETIYFRERMDSYPALFWGNLLLNFIMPFFILMRNDTKRKMGTLFLASAIVFFGHWFDFFNMIKPGARLTLIEMEAHEGGAHGADHGEEHATMDSHAGDDHAATADHADDHAAAGHGDEAHGDDHAAAGDHGEEHAAAGHGPVARPYKAGFTLPGLLEIGIFLGFLGGYLFFILYSLSKAPLEPKKDPYFEESLHHHT